MEANAEVEIWTDPETEVVYLVLSGLSDGKETKFVGEMTFEFVKMLADSIK